MSWFKDLIGYEPPQKTQQVGALLDAQPDKNQITMIGTMGAGKSSHIAGLIKAADRKVSTSRDTEHPFRYIIDEGSSNIIHDVSALRAGYFPPKTGASKRSYMEPGVTFEWTHVKRVGGQTITLSRKQARMPILDLAGEDLVKLITKVKEARSLDQISSVDADNAERITNKVNQSSGLMLIIKATRAQGLGFEIEKEPCDINGMSIYSDANLSRMVNGIIKYKHQHPESPPLKGIAIVITAWDGLAPVAKKISQITGQEFNPLDERISSESLDKFVYAFFPSTHAAITSLGISNIRYFPSYFLVERDSHGNPINWEGTQSPKIKRVELFDSNRQWQDNANTIYDSEKWFFKELDWLQEFATLG
jgi:hypothetical protein